MHLDLPSFVTRWAHRYARRRAIAAGAALGFLALLTCPSPSALAASASPTAQPSASPSASQPSAAGGKTTPPPVTFGIGPAATAGSVDLRSSFSFGVTPGAQASDKVTVFNYSLIPLQLAVYSVQAANTDTGAIGFSSATATPVDIASWLTVGTSRPVTVTVPGRPNDTKPPGQVTLPIKLAVPLNAEPGDHVGGVVAALAVTSHNAKGEQVTLEQRVVTRVYVRVSGPLHPKLEIVGMRASYHEKDLTVGPGSMSVTYTLRNVGNVRVQASQAVRVSGLLGATKTVHPPAIAQLLPGGSIDVSAVVRSVWPTVLVQPHVEVVPSALTGDVDPGLKPVSATTWTWAVPWAVVIVLVLIAVEEWQRRRRRKLRRPVPVTAPSRATSPVATRGVPVDASARHRVGSGSGRRSRHAR
jgi:hypothetical protein